jgi:hypothetical protein
MTASALRFVIVCCLSGGCERASRTATTEPAPSATTKVADMSVDPQPSTGGAANAVGQRELHPLEGNNDCMEMYSACKMVHGENLCTSAPFLLACGETARLPSTGEQLTCVCP